MTYLAWMLSQKYAVLAGWMAAIGTLLASVVALGIAGWGFQRDERRRRDEETERKRNDSILGAVIIESLIEEVANGLRIMKETFARIQNEPSPTPAPSREVLPGASWEGMSAIPDNVLLRIIAVSEGVEPRAFPPTQIRVHCKNYFMHMRENYNNAQFDANIERLLSTGAGNSQYIELAERVLNMLDQAKGLLEENARCPFPK